MNVKVELSPERFGLGLVQNLTAIAEGHANEKRVGGINKGDKCKYSSDPDEMPSPFLREAMLGTGSISLQGFLSWKIGEYLTGGCC